MRWVRTNRQFGSWCALLAIAIQIVFSFGHAHRFDAFRSSESWRHAASGIRSQSSFELGDPASKPIGLQFEYCAICVAIKMGASAVPVEAPQSGVPEVAGKTLFEPYPQAVISASGHLFFQARAPPPSV
jgi:hypothetical protein